MTDTLVNLPKNTFLYSDIGGRVQEPELEVNLDAIFAQLRWEPVPVSPDAFWASQQVFTKDAVKVYRGLSVQVKKSVLDKLVTTDDAGEALRKLANIDRIGIHWSDNLNSPKKFSGWNARGCECKECEPYYWSPSYLRDRIQSERHSKVEGAWSCRTGCSQCKRMKDKYLNGCRCNYCVQHGPNNCRRYCKSDAPCKTWANVTDRDVARYTDGNYLASVAVIVHGETEIESTLLEGDADYYDYRNAHGIYDYAEENEITLRYESKVRIYKAEFKSVHHKKSWNTDLTIAV